MIVISEKDIVEEKERMRLQFSVQHKIQSWARNIIQGPGSYRERGESQVKKLLAALELRAEIGDKVQIPGLAPEGLALLVLAGTDVILPPGARVFRKGRKVTVIYKGKSAVFLLPKHLFGVNDHENGNKGNDQENGNKGKKKGVNNKK